MKIDDKENVMKITFRHKNKTVKFQCITKPIPYISDTDLEKSEEVEIIFDDLLEVKELIYMLERFREECSEYIGHWNNT